MLGIGAVGLCLGRVHLGGRRIFSVAIEVEGWWHRMAGAGVIGMDLVAWVARRHRFGVVVWVGQYIGRAA